MGKVLHPGVRKWERLVSTGSDNLKQISM